MQNYKNFVLLLLLLNFFHVIALPLNTTFIENIYFLITNKYYLIPLILFIFILLNNTINQTVLNPNNLLRYKNKKETLKKITLIGTRTTLKLLLLNTLIQIIFINLFRGFDFNISESIYSNISLLSYTIFYLIRSVILIIMYMKITFLCLRVMSRLFNVIFHFLNILSCFSTIFNTSIIVSIFQLKIFFGDYFSVIKYDSFFLEILFSILFIVLCMGFYKFLERRYQYGKIK